MTIIFCSKDRELEKHIDVFAEILKTHAHTLYAEKIGEKEFYDSVFRGAVERIRGQYSAMMGEKREFVRRVLSYMEDRNFIKSFESSGGQNRYDYTVEMPSGRVAVIELKGGLDGNNTTIFERPAHADELIVWSVSTNPGGDPRRNVWSGLHTRLSAEIISNSKRVDGLIVWDWVCGTVGRRCPKLEKDTSRTTTVAQYQLPPPCIYVFPGKIPEVRSNPTSLAQSIQSVEILKAFHECFKGIDDELNYVDFEVANKGAEMVRKTIVRRNGGVIKESSSTPIRRK